MITNQEWKNEAMNLEIGVAVPPLTDGKEFTEVAQAAEAVGVDALWTYDAGRGEEPFARVGFLASITRRATLCAGVINPFLRHPAVLAGATATMDRLSGGRFRLVMGLGWKPDIENVLGVSRRRPYADFQASITIIKRLLAGEEVSYQGERFSLHGAKLGIAPIGSSIPIYVADGGRRALSIAAAHAEGYLASFGPDPRYVHTLKEITASVRRVERRLHLGFLMAFRADEPEAGLAAARRSLAWELATSASTDPYYAVAGAGPELVAAIRSVLGLDELIRQKRDPMIPYRDPSRLEAAGRLLPTDLVTTLAPTHNLIGPLPWALQRLGEIAELGVDFVVLHFPTRFRETLPALAELISRFRESSSQ